MANKRKPLNLGHIKKIVDKLTIGAGKRRATQRRKKNLTIIFWAVRQRYHHASLTETAWAMSMAVAAYCNHRGIMKVPIGLSERYLLASQRTEKLTTKIILIILELDTLGILEEDRAASRVADTGLFNFYHIHGNVDRGQSQDSILDRE